MYSDISPANNHASVPAASAEEEAGKLPWHDPEMIILAVNRETKAAPGSGPIQ